MGSLTGSFRARDGRTRTSTDEHGQNGEGIWYFARPSPKTRVHCPSTHVVPRSHALVAAFSSEFGPSVFVRIGDAAFIRIHTRATRSAVKQAVPRPRVSPGGQ